MQIEPYERRFHQGKWLRRQIDETGESISGFARRARVSRDALNKWFAQEELSIRVDSLVRVLMAIGFDCAKLLGGQVHLDYAIKSLDKENPNFGESVAPIQTMHLLISRAMSPIHGPPARIPRPFMRLADQIQPNARIAEPPKEGRLTKVPIINKIPAGALAVFTDLDYPGGFADDYLMFDVGEKPAFGMYIEGNSMSPRYEHGDLALFRNVDPLTHRIVEGGDYAIQLDGSGDEESFFKQLFTDPKGGGIWLVAKSINPETRPKSVKVDRRQIGRLGKAFHTIHGERRGR
jgi:hypothetical protein